MIARGSLAYPAAGAFASPRHRPVRRGARKADRAGRALTLALLIPLVLVTLGAVSLAGAAPATDSRAPAAAIRPVRSGSVPGASRGLTADPYLPPPLLAPARRVDTPAGPPSPTQTPAQHYVVRPGDELRYIAAANHVTMGSILALNDIPHADSLRVGQVLTLPSDH